MSLLPDTSQGIADALGYLQHHLQKLMKRQHVSENNINTTLAALTMQLQQLTQLVANPSLPAIPNTPPRLYHLLRRHDELVLSSLLLQTSAENVTMAARS